MSAFHPKQTSLTHRPPSDRRREQGMVGEHEKSSVACASKDELNGTLGHVNLTDGKTGRVVNEYLSVSDVDPSFTVGHNAFATTIGEKAQIGQRAAVANECAVGAVFGFTADEHALADLRGHEPQRVERIREAPAGMVGR